MASLQSKNTAHSTAYIILCTPWLLSRFAFDLVLTILPQTRPTAEWSMLQAARMRLVRLFLLYWSLARSGNRLSLREGKEKERFEIGRPANSKLYRGPLSDADIGPGLVGMTWTPSRPPPPESINSEVVVNLHIHGGAFVIGDGRDEDTGFLARTMIRHMGVTHVCSPQYRLADGELGRFPAPVQDALTTYLWLLHEKKIPASQIILSGDSAGANIALGLLRYISEHGREDNIPFPAAVGLWSPWVDVSAAFIHDMEKSPNFGTDYINSYFSRWGASAITGFGAIDPMIPYLSPLHHPFRIDTDIPVFINAGEREVLVDEIESFAQLYSKFGWKTHLLVSKACPHDIILLGPQIGFDQEAEEAARNAGKFLANNTNKHAGMPMIMDAQESPSSNAAGSQLHDIIIIGAGISGINSAYRIQTEAPSHLNYVILEGRESLGGTWDLFRYPGIRSDSDIFTFGFPWSPWGTGESLPAGGKIKNYIERSARSAGIDKNIRYQHSVASADWLSDTQRWKLRVNVPDQPEALTFEARFVILGTGYYDYKTPLQATIPGIQNFGGKLIHPQFWPEDYDYTGKNVVVIGSGATAVTILPSMTDSASRVTMLQRSPGYIMPLPSTSLLISLLFTLLPAMTAHFISRIIWLFKSYITTAVCKKCPGLAKSLIRRRTIRELPPDISWDPHFKPRYNPWEQRFCACMDGDFFAALRSGKADVVTDRIKTVTEKTIELESGATLHPDIIVTATGLKLKFGGGIAFRVDGKSFDVADKFAWKSVMLQDVPNLFFMTGYENASWTLGADVGARLFVRILRRMEEIKARSVVPRLASPEDMPATPMMRLTSTYLENASRVLPKGGTGHWGPKSNYFVDMAGARWGSIPKDLEMI
ncbi:hypothetical protein F5X68DRAFT_242201 [Plectosphaerella plurivora]|uniref:Alpha/beta hydrolase fold-3 domain-containing protein n=1 Tax=Plectosphaerella plurivora TaxID=936078 RepID=A0A9P8VAI9_9PEZI|nr:hypothetical protein F5X68DRAFT_242201 [Plectosphaerella plurivora]